MKIYRYQNAEGIGPYNAAWPWSKVIRKEHGSEDQKELRPSPMFDERWSKGYPTDKHYYGCPSEEIILDWFDGWHLRLAEWGFKIVVVEVDPVENRLTCGSSGR